MSNHSLWLHDAQRFVEILIPDIHRSCFGRRDEIRGKMVSYADLRGRGFVVIRTRDEKLLAAAGAINHTFDLGCTRQESVRSVNARGKRLREELTDARPLGGAGKHGPCGCICAKKDRGAGGKQFGPQVSGEGQHAVQAFSPHEFESAVGLPVGRGDGERGSKGFGIGKVIEYDPQIFKFRRRVCRRYRFRGCRRRIGCLRGRRGDRLEVLVGRCERLFASETEEEQGRSAKRCEDAYGGADHIHKVYNPCYNVAMTGTLFVVATPIGNLEDITERARRTLSEVDAIACEDTRVTSKLLAHLGVKKPLISLHEHTSARGIASVVERLRGGASIAYASDAGTPGVNDPGGKLVAACFDAGVFVTPIPGPSALTAAISVCGFPMDEFTYLGFVPHKKGRETMFREIASRKTPSVFFESTHRIEKTLAGLSTVLSPDRLVFVGRELTKMHETLYRGTVDEAIQQLHTTSTKGEFVIIVGPV